MTTLFGNNSFKLGLFGINCSGGCVLSSAPERWTASWSDIVAVTRLADEAGVEFILPIARWRGLGDSFVWEKSLETFTQAAALGALTRNIGMFVTAHVPLVSPAYAAKAIATIDHVTNGRVGLNIVCGWNADEFAMHGVKMDGDRRYEQGLEWTKIFLKLLEGGPDFDWDGEFYSLRNMTTDPLTLQKPHPPIVSAGSSSGGQEFAAQVANIMFTTLHSYETTGATVARLLELAAQHGRRPEVYVQSLVVCRPTRKEAEEYYHYFAAEHADPEALAYFKRQKNATLAQRTREGDTAADRATVARMREADERYPGNFPGMNPIIGTPDDIEDEMRKMHSIGLSGSALVFLNYLNELPYFVQEAIPRLEKAGLRGNNDATASRGRSHAS